MKLTFLFPIFFFAILSSTNAQQISYIRFRHVGEQTKPIGTLTICLEKLVEPLDSSLNSQLGSIVVTDTDTYLNVKNFISRSRKITYEKKDLSLRSGTFEILIRDKPYGYITDDKSDSFFRKLIQYLKKQNSDQKVIMLLGKYINKSS